ncbi:hypothetical protein LSH36_356g00009, partial [Paralvinella palmiformis]
MGEYIAYETIIANRSVMRQHSFTNPINKPYRKDYSIIGCSIGFAIARRMAQEGANVMVSSRKSENVEKAVHQLQSEGLDVRGVKCHVGDPKQRTNLITETVKTFGQLDILVLNASVNPHVGEMLE